MELLFISAFALFLQAAQAANAADWRSRSIYQVFTDRFARTDGSTSYPCDPANNIYCGGTWKGLQNKLDYIKNMGFSAIWISPITAQVPEAYHGYWQTSLYDVNEKFGSAEDLKALATAAHSKGMYLMIDVVPNHMGWAGCHDTVNYTHYRTFNKPEYYHNYCALNNMKNQTEVEACWMGNCNLTMPDLRTDRPEVATELGKWIKSLVKDYSLDGLRIDSVKNVNKDFFPGWCQAAGVFCMGEVSEGEATYTYPYQKYMDSVLDYPLYYAITRTFTKQSNMSDLVVNLAACTQNAENGCKDNTVLGTFLENHDNPRFPSLTKDISLAKNAIAFTILSDGIPIMYQGQEQHLAGADDPFCREALWLTRFDTTAPLYKHTSYLNQIRNHVSSKNSKYLTQQTKVVHYTADTIQLRKDAIRTILTNKGNNAAKENLKTESMGFNANDDVVDVLSCNKYKADSKGEVEVKMERGEPAVLVPRGILGGSNICG